MSWFRRIRRWRKRPSEARSTAAATPADSLPPTPPAPLAPPAPTAAQAARVRLAIAEGILTREALREEIERAGAAADPLGRALLDLPYPSLDALAPALSRSIVPKIDPARIDPAPDALALLPPEMARRHEALPLRRFGDVLCVAMSRPEDVVAVEEIRRVSGRRLKVIRAHGDVVRRFISEHYPLPPSGTAARAYRLRAVPIDEEEIEAAIRAGGEAAKAVAEWESIWVHGDVLAAEGVEE